MNTINPEEMDIVEWCDRTAGALAEEGIGPMRISDESEWREWGIYALRMVGFQGVQAPNPYLFDDWKEWAMRFNETVENL